MRHWARNWSIRTTLLALGGMLVVLLSVVGGMGLHVLRYQAQSFDVTLRGDEAALNALNETETALLYTRVALDHARTLADNGDWPEAQRAQTRAEMLYRYAQDSWQRYLSAPAEPIDNELLATLGTRYGMLTHFGIELEIAALRGNHAATYRALSDGQVSLLSEAFDDAITNAVAAYEAHVEMRRRAAIAYTDSMTGLAGIGMVGAMVVLALLSILLGLLVGRIVIVPRTAASTLPPPEVDGDTAEIVNATVRAARIVTAGAHASAAQRDDGGSAPEATGAARDADAEPPPATAAAIPHREPY